MTKKKLHLVWYYSFKEVMRDVMQKSTGDGGAQNFFKYRKPIIDSIGRRMMCREGTTERLFVGVSCMSVSVGS